MKNLISVAILVLAATMLACQGSRGRLFLRRLPDRVRRLRRGDGAEPTVLGECSNGMVMQPGEGCSYEGEEGRPADIVISVGADGSICREKVW